MRAFVIIGSKAKASPDFLLNDIPSTSGRLDVLLRALRAALLVSHGVRRDTRAYLVLQGEPSAVTTLRFDGAAAKYLRPDDRSLATLIKKALAAATDSVTFEPVRPGVAVSRAGLEAITTDLAGADFYILDEHGTDVREAAVPAQADGPSVFIVGDHLGFDPQTRAGLAGLDAAPLSVGPESLHSEDAIVLMHNELDRRMRVVRPADSR